MIKVNPYAVIEGNLREGETLQGELEKLKGLALAWLWHFKEDMFRQINADRWLSTRLAAAPLSEVEEIMYDNYDRSVLERYHRRIREHLQGYFGEVALHTWLHADWHLVYKFNALGAHQPDGYIGAETYNVKTRGENKWGLSVQGALLEDYYILAHEFSGYVYVIGFALKDEVEMRRELGFGFPARLLHPIEFFVSQERIIEGLKFKVAEPLDYRSAVQLRCLNGKRLSRL